MAAKVSVVVSRPQDWTVMDEACSLLDTFQIPFEKAVRSAGRTPEQTREYALGLEARGIQVVIGAAGLADSVAAAVAAYVTLPVIAVPLETSPLGGFDALIAAAQMPAGVPVAALAIGKTGARNAAVLAAQILSLHDPDLRVALRAFRAQLSSLIQGP